MKIESLNDLKKLISLCRKSGVYDIKVDGIELHLSPEPVKRSNKPKAAFSAPERAEDLKIPMPNIPEAIETPDAPTEEELLFWSAGPAPGEQ